jgi:hypothetical protein
MDQFASTETGEAEGRVPDGPIPSLLAGFARSMHAAAKRERDRIAALVAADARTQIEKTHARAAIEADAMRRSADEDIRGIQMWSTREVKRIRREATQRTKERHSDLASYLERHETIIATEIAGVETAIAEYSAQLDRFVEDLVGSSDPAEIARLADLVPAPPDLDAARGRARAAAVSAFEKADDPGEPDEPDTPAEPAERASDLGLAVMDPEADGRPGDLPGAVDAPQVPEDQPAAIADEATSPEETNGPMRLFRALAPWTTDSSSRTEDDAEARRS